MRRSTILTLLATALAVLLFCPEVNASEESIWRYLYPGTKSILGVDIQRAKNSPTGKMLARQWSQAGGFKLTGNDLDILDSIDRVLISSNGLPLRPGQKPPFVIAIQGRLDRAVIQKMAPKGTAIQKFKGTDLFVPFNSRADDPLLALIDAQFALLGDRESLALVLDSQGASSADPEVTARAMQFASECEIFVVSRESLAGASGAEGAEKAAVPGLKQLEEIQSMDLGISLSQGLGLKGIITAKDPASAQGMAMMAQLFSTMVLNDPKQANSEFARIVRSLKVSTEGPVVNISIDVPLAQLEKGVMQFRASMKDAGQKSLESLIGVKPAPGAIPGLRPAASPQLAQAAQEPPPPPRPAVPVKRTIKIVGLDSGDKEVSYTSTASNQ